MKKLSRTFALVLAVAGIATVMMGCQEAKPEAATEAPKDHPAH